MSKNLILRLQNLEKLLSSGSAEKEGISLIVSPEDERNDIEIINELRMDSKLNNHNKIYIIPTFIDANAKSGRLFIVPPIQA